MVQVRDTPESISDRIRWSRVGSLDLISFLQFAEKTCDSITIESGKYKFDSAGDLKDNWRFVSDEMKITLTLESPNRCWSYISISEERLYFSVETLGLRPESFIVADSTKRFARRSKSVFKQATFLCSSVLGLLLFFFAGIFMFDDNQFAAISLGIPIAVAGLGLFFGAGRLTEFLLPTIHETHGTGRSHSIKQYLILPTVGATIAGLLLFLLERLIPW